MKKRAVITGYGALSCIGSNVQEIRTSLEQSRSGIGPKEDYKARNMRCHIAGSMDIPSAGIDRKKLRFMSATSALAWLAAEAAVAHAGLSPEEVGSERTAAFMGAGGNGVPETYQAFEIERTKGARKLGPYFVTKTMDNSPSAIVSTFLGIRGPSYSISSACATSSHCIGTAYEQILLGNIDRALAGGSDEECWPISMLFDAMGALSSRYNDSPQIASRPFDAERDGFVPSGGGGIVVVEERETALKRGAPVLAEIVGYAATSDGADMVAPSGEGAERCMRIATRDCELPDYINAHATSTPAGDIAEMQAARQVFGDRLPPISSTKALTGHALGGAGALELIYSLLMLEGDFLTPCVNLENPDSALKDYPLLREKKENAGLRRILSNSFGFGGTNASLVIEKPTD